MDDIKGAGMSPHLQMTLNITNDTIVKLRKIFDGPEWMRAFDTNLIEDEDTEVKPDAKK